MTPDQTALLLGKCASIDQRTVGRADVLAWHEIIGRYELRDCLDAVTLHYQESTQRAMPADIRHLAIGIRDRRKSAEAKLSIEAGPTTQDRAADVTTLVHKIAERLPRPDAQARAVARARRERGRPEPPKPKPPKKHKRKDWSPPATDEIARFAMRYLIDGHPPADVSERLAVSRKWCDRMVRKLKRSTDQLAAQEDDHA